MLFDMLAKRSHGAFLSTSSRFEFSIELYETIPLRRLARLHRDSERPIVLAFGAGRW
jgi:hypothetical protein